MSLHQQTVHLPDPTKNASYNLSKSTVSNGANDTNRRIYVVRHAERVDFVFGEWIPPCFDESGQYVRKDSNMPKHLPVRINSPSAWLLDSPITNIGRCQARLTGDAMKEAGAVISYAYCSPSYRCVQTCHGILEGLGMTHVKIRIEFALFEWMLFYRDNKPEWCTKDELYADNFNIDMEYEPMMSKKELLDLTNENCEEFYRRNHSVVEQFLKSHASGNALMVGHSCTPETCTRLLVGKEPRTKGELFSVLQKVPYCGMVAAEYSPATNEWQLRDSSGFSVTHKQNDRLEWSAIDN
ncbi:protein UBASH3A homolog isoform X2 [Bradysia coprophila]|nr:protein UBASH3A homolog isoform X2 [Bradysia coprophila]XP_037040513.1 protein UBASH3A homolog isoform X2 [Bradysia coprophila]